MAANPTDLEKDFKIIAITQPEIISGELIYLCELLEGGAIDIMHLRKPGASIEKIRNLLLEIPEHLHNKVRLHSFFELSSEFKLNGIHLNNRFPTPPDNSEISISKSCHSTEEILVPNCYDYVTFSPIFESISKIGYGIDNKIVVTQEILENHNVVALGGVTPDKIASLRDSGFYGCAMLGAITEGITRFGTSNFKNKLLQIRTFR